MQIFNKQFWAIPVGYSMKMESSAYFHFDSLALPAGIDSHFMSSSEAFFQSHELLLSALWMTDLPQSTLLNLRTCIVDAVPAKENFIFVSGLAVRNTSDSISFFEDGNINRIAEMHFSVAVSADADCGLFIDPERATVFWITVIGMEPPVNSGLKFVNFRARCNLRKRFTGRMICLLKQQLNL